MKFKPKDIMVDAQLVPTSMRALHEAPEWLRERMYWGREQQGWMLRTQYAGDVVLKIDDYIVRLPDGTVCTINTPHFVQQYEPEIN